MLNSEVEFNAYSSTGNVNDNIRSVITEQVALEIEKYKEQNKDEERKKKKEKENQRKVNEKGKGAVVGFMLFFWFLLIGGLWFWIWEPTDSTGEFSEHLVIMLCICGSLGIVSCCYGIRSCFKIPKHKE
jgi:hypothetical protein